MGAVGAEARGGVGAFQAEGPPCAEAGGGEEHAAFGRTVSCYSVLLSLGLDTAKAPVPGPWECFIRIASHDHRDHAV